MRQDHADELRHPRLVGSQKRDADDDKDEEEYPDGFHGIEIISI